MATLASGQDQKFQIWRGEIDWFGEKRSVDLDVPDIERHHDDRSSTNRRTSIVIGTKLLSFCKLEIDFIDRALKIIKLM